MTNRNIKYTFLLMLLACIALTACKDDGFVDSSEEGVNGLPEYIRDGYSLNVVVTLDKMGGSHYTRGESENPRLEELENYIDPEKFRVLFFNDKDELLFESKSRWVKQFDAENRWLVSVPVFTYGDDLYKDEETEEWIEWNWKEIREALTSNSFKIAILANRPEMEWYPGNLKATDPDQEMWIDNTGPHWTPKDYLTKTVFDLHHCQHDPIYHGKSAKDGFYDFIMGNWLDETVTKWPNTDATLPSIKPEMGATSSWVEWGEVTDNHGWEKRHTILPSQTHPIPMYGIQKFDPITDWQEGTPYNLSTDIPGDYLNGHYEKRSISLLRSVVKLELKIPAKDGQGNKLTKPNYVVLCYPNIYARCEPMDVWTPTDELWKQQHPENFDFNDNSQCKDMEAILKYGPIATANNVDNSSASKLKESYQKKISWFYGVWCEDKTGTDESQKGKNPWWDFETGTGVKFNYFPSVDYYPRMFNSCIQRNAVVVCDDNGDLSFDSNSPYRYTDEDYYHYVAYVGERNLNDPSDLGNMTDKGGGKPTVMYWHFNIGTTKYGLPITDYSNPKHPIYETVTEVQNNITNTAPRYKFETMANNNERIIGNLNNITAKQMESLTGINGGFNNGNGVGYMQAVMDLTNPDESYKLPWPLIRNHVYTITVTSPSSPAKTRVAENGMDDFIITSEDRYSKSLKVD